MPWGWPKSWPVTKTVSVSTRLRDMGYGLPIYSPQRCFAQPPATEDADERQWRPPLMMASLLREIEEPPWREHTFSSW